MTDRPETPRVWPTDIRVRQQTRVVQIDFDDGSQFELPAELLRVESPSAEVQGHGEGKTVVAGKRHVNVLDMQPVGNYAVRIIFDDGHDTGLYSWDYLYGLGRNNAAIWADYLEVLAAQGLSRDPS